MNEQIIILLQGYLAVLTSRTATSALYLPFLGNLTSGNSLSSPETTSCLEPCFASAPNFHFVIQDVFFVYQFIHSK